MNIFITMVSPDFQSSNSYLKYHQNTGISKFLFCGRNIFNNIEEIDGKETNSKTLGIQHLEDGTLLCPGLRMERYWSVQQAGTSKIQ